MKNHIELCVFHSEGPDLSLDQPFEGGRRFMSFRGKDSRRFHQPFFFFADALVQGGDLLIQ